MEEKKKRKEAGDGGGKNLNSCTKMAKQRANNGPGCCYSFQSPAPEIGCYYYSQALPATPISLQIIQEGQTLRGRAEREL